MFELEKKKRSLYIILVGGFSIWRPILNNLCIRENGFLSVMITISPREWDLIHILVKNKSSIEFCARTVAWNCSLELLLEACLICPKGYSLFLSFLVLVSGHWKEYQSRYSWAHAHSVLVSHSPCPGHGVLLTTVPTPPSDSTVCLPCVTVLPAGRHIVIYSSASASHSLRRTGICKWVHHVGREALATSCSSGG